jgi:farnesyl diphosphate synthase
LIPEIATEIKSSMSSAQETAFAARLAAIASDTDALISQLLGDAPQAGERARPPRLLAAMRHAALDGGKRLRPFLVVETADLFGVARSQALTAAAALECLHCYSLVHDDLPAMDNDAMRRGKPTVHKAFDEATAILAGDALLTLAFDVMARADVHPDPAVRIALIVALARAAGVGGMAGGQMMDLAAEGRFGAREHQTESGVTALQAMKTGALIRFACQTGAMLGGASAAERGALERFGDAVGAAFQIADDLLDLEGDSAAMGKRTGKDAAAGKATLASILGVDAARRRLAALVEEADSALAVFDARADMLRAAARFIAERRA